MGGAINPNFLCDLFGNPGVYRYISRCKQELKVGCISQNTRELSLVESCGAGTEGV